jgi:hypothetical protein
MTQEFLSLMFNVRHLGVTEAMHVGEATGAVRAHHRNRNSPSRAVDADCSQCRTESLCGQASDLTAPKISEVIPFGGSNV